MSMNTNTNDTTTNTTTPSTATASPAFFNGLSELADFLRCEPVTIRRMMRRKALPYIKLGGRYLFRRSEIEEVLQRHTVPAVGMRRARA